MVKMLIIFVIFMSWQVLTAQSADTFFHSAAGDYIGNDIPGALINIQNGLHIDPSDPKLLALLEKIKEQEKEKQDQNSGQNDQEQQQEQQEQQKNKEEQKQNEEQQEKPEDQSESSPQDEKSKQEGEEKDKENEEQQPPPSSGEEKKQISREAALQILKALENEEKNSKIKQRPVRSRGEKRENDW